MATLISEEVSFQSSPFCLEEGGSKSHIWKVQWGMPFCASWRTDYFTTQSNCLHETYRHIRIEPRVPNSKLAGLFADTCVFLSCCFSLLCMHCRRLEYDPIYACVFFTYYWRYKIFLSHSFHLISEIKYLRKMIRVSPSECRK